MCLSSAVLAFVGRLPTRKVGGIGKVLEKVLSAFNMTSMSDVRGNMPKILSSFTPAVSEFLLHSSLGISQNEGEKKEVVNEHSLEVTRKTLGAERTFSLCCESFSEQKLKLKELSEKVCTELKEKSLWGKTVTLKVKTIKFELLTRSVTNKNYFQCADVIEKMTVKLLSALIPIKIRLIGITISKFIQKPTAASSSSSSSSSSSNSLSSFFKVKNITTSGNILEKTNPEIKNMTKKSKSNILDFHDDVDEENFKVRQFDDNFDNDRAAMDNPDSDINDNGDYENSDDDDDDDNNDNSHNDDHNDNEGGDDDGDDIGTGRGRSQCAALQEEQEHQHQHQHQHGYGDGEIRGDNRIDHSPYGGNDHSISHDSILNRAHDYNLKYGSKADIYEDNDDDDDDRNSYKSS